MTTKDKKDFCRTLDKLSKDINEWAIRQGFWEGEGCSIGEKIALMHSELSEALDAQRNNNPPDNHIPEFSGLEAEMADVVIRVLDFCKHHELRIGEAILAKVKYNNSRPIKNGRVNF